MVQLLVVTAVTAERDAALRADGAATPMVLGPFAAVRVDAAAGPVVALAGGVGPAAAATATAGALAAERFDAVLCVGVAGGLAGRAGPADVVVGTAAVAADLGAAAPDGFHPLDDLGFGPARLPADPWADRLARRLEAAGLAVVRGDVLTVSTVTGTDQRAAELAGRHPTAVAEAMEGFGVACAAAAYGRPVVEIRTISNRVGRRDRSGWDLPGALDRLAEVGATLLALTPEELP